MAAGEEYECYRSDHHSHPNGSAERASVTDGHTYPTPTATLTPVPKRFVVPTQSTIQSVHPTVVQSGLSNDRYYTNVDGDQVHSPAYSNDSFVPAGASAICGDGTYSFSQHRSGTCSHHGGVSQWL